MPVSRPRYRVKRGRRVAFQWDVLIYDGTELVFGGSFFPRGIRRLTKDEIGLIEAIRTAVAGRG